MWERSHWVVRPFIQTSMVVHNHFTKIWNTRKHGKKWGMPLYSSNYYKLTLLQETVTLNLCPLKYPLLPWTMEIAQQKLLQTKSNLFKRTQLTLHCKVSSYYDLQFPRIKSIDNFSLCYLSRQLQCGCTQGNWFKVLLLKGSTIIFITTNQIVAGIKLRTGDTSLEINW